MDAALWEAISESPPRGAVGLVHVQCCFLGDLRQVSSPSGPQWGEIITMPSSEVALLLGFNDIKQGKCMVPGTC